MEVKKIPCNLWVSPRIKLALAFGLAAVLLTAVMLSAGVIVAAPHGTFLISRLTYTQDSDRHVDDPAISGNGNWVAFSSDADFLNQGIPESQYEIWLYNTSTSALKRVTTATGAVWPFTCSSFQPNLNQDGSQIAFRSNSDFLNQGIGLEDYQIWLYDVQTMALTRVTTPSQLYRKSWAPSQSGDGSRVVFYSDADFLGQGIPQYHNEIWMYDTPAMTLTRITSGTGNSTNPSLSRDGNRVAFASSSNLFNPAAAAAQYDVWLYDTQVATYTRVTTCPQKTRTTGHISISGDGRWVAFLSDCDYLGQGIPEFQQEVWLVDTFTKVLTRVTTTTDSTRSNGLPSLNGDGRWLAFASNNDFLNQGLRVGEWEIWLYDRQEATLTRATTSTDVDRDSQMPAIDQAGSRFAFYSDADFQHQGNGIGHYEMWLASLAGEMVYLPQVVKPGN